MTDQIVQDIQLQGWSYRPQLLVSEDLFLMNDYFRDHHAEFNPAKVGSQDNKTRNLKIRGDYTLWLNSSKFPMVFHPLKTILSEIKKKLNQRYFLGLEGFECHLAFYPPGTFYKKHSDRMENSSQRSVSFIFYLNEDWEEDNGGELILYHQDGSILKTIYPSPGAFICFLSGDFPHEVRAATKERRTLTGWFIQKRE